MIEPSDGESRPRDPGSPLWQFSLGFYARPGVSEACIALQDSCGLDANVLLFLLWLARNRRVADAAELAGVLRNTRDWQAEVIAVLRSLRRKTKNGAYVAFQDGVDLLRAKIKTLELDAERVEQDHLYALAADPAFGHAGGTVENATVMNLALYESALGCAFPAAATETLRRALNATQTP
jgi:uncharacterized protein (TIGR02444 family)